MSEVATEDGGMPNGNVAIEIFGGGTPGGIDGTSDARDGMGTGKVGIVGMVGIVGIITYIAAELSEVGG